MANYIIEKVSDPVQLAYLASQIIASYINLTLEKKERAQLALSGGSTPASAYRLLGKEYLAWERVDVFLGDERWVDSNDESSNARMLRETLLSSEPGSNASFYPVSTTEQLNPNKSAEVFSGLIQKVCIGKPPIFDLMVLGLGEDGHTASLFPGTKSLKVKDSWTTVSEGKGLARITLTSPVLSSANKVIFLVCGSNKKHALKRLLDPCESSERTPARLVQPNSEILLLVDEAASALI